MTQKALEGSGVVTFSSVSLEMQALRGVHVKRLECEKNWTVVVAGGGVSRSEEEEDLSCCITTGISSSRIQARCGRERMGKGLVSDYCKSDEWDHLHVTGDCRDDLCPASSDEACRYVRGDENKEVQEGKKMAVRLLFWGSNLGSPFPSELFKRLGGAAAALTRVQ